MLAIIFPESIIELCRVHLGKDILETGLLVIEGVQFLAVPVMTFFTQLDAFPILGSSALLGVICAIPPTKNNASFMRHIEFEALHLRISLLQFRPLCFHYMASGKCLGVACAVALF